MILILLYSNARIEPSISHIRDTLDKNIKLYDYDYEYEYEGMNILITSVFKCVETCFMFKCGM